MTTPGQNGLENNSNKGVIPQTRSLTIGYSLAILRRVPLFLGAGVLNF